MPHTSPSPWAAWVSPIDNNAPSTSTGRRKTVPADISLISKFPPTFLGGTTECNPFSASARPMVPTNGLRATLPPASNSETVGLLASKFQM